MAYRIKLDGTTRPAFEIGLQGITLDGSSVASPWTLVFPPTAGTAGYALVTDGLGVTSWAAIGAAADSTTPYHIPVGETFTNNINRQNLFTVSIDVEGTLVVDGQLIEV